MIAGIRFRAVRIKRRLFPPAYEPDFIRRIREVAPVGGVCADVGAHVGIVSRALARKVGPEGRVIAFEAHPTNASRLAEGLRHEGFARVRVENVAVTDGAEPTAWLHPGRGHNDSEWNTVGHDVEGRETPPEVEVVATSLDDYFVGGRVDLVKIDVEGAEDRVLAGMRRLLRDAHPVVLIEFHDGRGWAGRRHLYDAGYRLFRLDGSEIRPEQEDRVYHCLALPPGATRPRRRLRSLISA